MRYLLFFLFFSSHIFAQQSDVFRIDSLPNQGILLDKGWKWHAGDNPDFAKADFDDSAWESIDPTKDIMGIEQVRNAPLSWFRLKIEVDSSYLGKTLAFLFKQTGASEIYLNGIKINQFGKLSDNQATTKGYDPQGKSFPLQLSNNKHQVIAIRFATTDIFLTKFGLTFNPILAIKISHIDNIVDNNRTYSIGKYGLRSQLMSVFKMGLFLALGFLHLFFFLFYKQKKSNLYFSLYSLLLGISYGLLCSTEYIYDINIRNYVIIITCLLTPIPALLLFLAVRELFDSKKGTMFWFMVILFIISIPFMLRPYQWGNVLGAFLHFILTGIAISQIAWNAYKKGIKGSVGIDRKSVV